MGSAGEPAKTAPAGMLFVTVEPMPTKDPLCTHQKTEKTENK